MMQTLALYTVLAPALRSTGPRYEFWTWFLSLLTLGSGIASVVVWPSLTTLASLLACVLQQFVALQLVFSLNIGAPEIQSVHKKKEA